MNLLIDSGNSRLKWACLAEGILCPGSSVAGGKALTDAALDRVWGELNPVPDKVWIANVAGQSVAEMLCLWSRTHWRLEPCFLTTQAEGFGVINGYQQPELLGVDRWLALIAVRHHHPLPAVIVDFGTALTLDVLDGDGRHRGGLICPGLNLMYQSLGNGTAGIAIDGEKIEGDSILGQSTRTAVRLGIHHAVLGMIERVMHKLQKEWPQLHVILTGGDADEVALRLSAPVHRVPDLVLKGLAVVSQQQ